MTSGVYVRNTKNRNRSEARKKVWKNPVVRAKIIKSLKESKKLKKSMIKQWKNPIYKKHMIKKMKNSWKQPGRRERASKKSREVWQRSGYKEKMSKNYSKIQKEIWQRPGYKDKMCKKARKRQKDMWRHPIYRREMSKKRLEMWQRPEFKEKMRVKRSKTSKDLWKNSVYREKCIKAIARGNRRRPTNPEKFLISCFNKNKVFYKYIGDGSMVVAGKNPDFINIDEKRKVIDYFSPPFHTVYINRTKEEAEKERIEHFEKNGYKCLVLWPEDLKDEERLLTKIREFDCL